MRFVRERLEVVTCYIPSTGEAVGDTTFQKTPCKEHYPPNACFNVFWYKQPTWTPPICKYIIEYNDNLKSLESASEGASAVVRLFSMKKFGNGTIKRASGSGFYILPNTIITNSHVSNEIQSIGKAYAYSNAWNVNSTSKISELPTKEATLFCGKTIKNVKDRSFPVTLNWEGIDPITTTVGDFDFFDFSASQFSGSPSNVFFIPSPRVVQTNDDVITLSYPGDENQSSPFSSSDTYVDWAPSESFLRDNIFNGYGKLCASVGKILHPYSLKENGFVERVDDFSYNKTNQECLASSECLIFGSSGGVMISKFSKVFHISGYTLIEFHAVHTGGEFIRCSKCLKHLHIAQKNIKISPDTWRFCERCDEDEDLSFNDPIPYSTSISVHSKPFVEFYSLVVLPKIREIFSLNEIPSLLEYCNMHQCN